MDNTQNFENTINRKGEKPLESPREEAPKRKEEPVISIRGLCVRLGGRDILDNVDMDIMKGTTVAVMGLSGMGKSTLLRCIIRLMEPDAGQIFIDGSDILKMKREELERTRKKMGMVFQKAALFDSMTLSQNVGFGLKEHSRKSDEEILKIVKEKLAIVDLEGKENNLPSELSGGMQKRASLARAICTDPEIILYDEPTTGLDPIISNSINNLINDMRKRFGVTSVLVTHDLESAYMVADEIAMLHGGRIIEKGAPDAFKNSENPVVHQFVNGSTKGPIKV